jgi:hypothetical protein
VYDVFSVLEFAETVISNVRRKFAKDIQFACDAGNMAPFWMEGSRAP